MQFGKGIQEQEEKQAGECAGSWGEGGPTIVCKLITCQVYSAVLCIPTTLLGRSSLLLFCEEQAQMFSPIADVPHLKSGRARNEIFIPLVVVSPTSASRST